MPFRRARQPSTTLTNKVGDKMACSGRKVGDLYKGMRALARLVSISPHCGRREDYARPKSWGGLIRVAAEGKT
jgi:hypothetical protein